MPFSLKMRGVVRVVSKTAGKCTIWQSTENFPMSQSISRLPVSPWISIWSRVIECGCDRFLDGCIDKHTLILDIYYESLLNIVSIHNSNIIGCPKIKRYTRYILCLRACDNLQINGILKDSEAGISLQVSAQYKKSFNGENENLPSTYFDLCSRNPLKGIAKGCSSFCFYYHSSWWTRQCHSSPILPSS